MRACLMEIPAAGQLETSSCYSLIFACCYPAGDWYMLARGILKGHLIAVGPVDVI